MTAGINNETSSERLYSLDFFRGLTMFLLIAEFTGLFHYMIQPSLENSWLNAIGQQFHHHPWSGLRFWDLIQPFFMFIVGVAMPFSFRNRSKKGQSKRQIRNHVLKRSFLLLLFGWGLYCVGAGKIVFKFQNVLAQLSVTYLLAYLVMKKSVGFQVIFSLILIVLTEVIYRTFSVEGFDHAFLPSKNFGTWLDLQYGGADLGGHWVSFNAIPTAAHTIWGVLAGQLLMSSRIAQRKLIILAVAGAILLFVGYAISPITPIVKRICTSSFVLVSGGWTILALALCYWLIDLKKWRKGVFFFAVVGMNPLFIYLFAHLDGAAFIRNMVAPFTNPVLSWMGETFLPIFISLIVLYLLWYLCFWLYRKKIFIRI